MDEEVLGFMIRIFMGGIFWVCCLTDGSQRGL